MYAYSILKKKMREHYVFTHMRNAYTNLYMREHQINKSAHNEKKIK